MKSTGLALENYTNNDQQFNLTWSSIICFIFAYL